MTIPSMAIAMEPKHLRIVQDILSRHLPANAQVWAYGSRARGVRVWRGSDLDLMVDAGAPLEYAVIEALTAEFTESSVPFAIDLHDRRTTSPEFIERVMPDMVPVPIPAAASS